jgi:uncharacterized membrane protein HdeD (DUF308 family)
MRISLVIIAIFFIISGVWDAWEMLQALLKHNLDINLGVLTIVIGIGLLQHYDRARKFGRFCAWFGVIITGIALFSVLSHSATDEWFGQIISGDNYYFFGVSFCAISAAFFLWIDYVLRHPIVRSLMK